MSHFLFLCCLMACFCTALAGPPRAKPNQNQQLVEVRAVQESSVCRVLTTKVFGGIRKCSNLSSDVNALAGKVEKNLDQLAEKIKILTDIVQPLVELVSQMNVKMNASQPLRQEENEQNNKELEGLSKCKGLDVDSAFTFKVANSIIFYSKYQANWRLARDFCKLKGMRQPSLTTLSLVEEVATALKGRASVVTRFWVSGNDINRPPGQFYWAEGTPVDNSFRGSDETYQHGEGKEACIYVDSVFNKIYDEECIRAYHILCEVPEELKSCL